MAHGKAEVCDFDIFSSNEDVGWLQVAMNDAPRMQIVVAIDDLIHEWHCILFWDGPAGGDVFGEISTLAQFSDDVCVVFGREYIENF